MRSCQILITEGPYFQDITEDGVFSADQAKNLPGPDKIVGLIFLFHCILGNNIIFIKKIIL
jgi:hypothetical protein